MRQAQRDIILIDALRSQSNERRFCTCMRAHANQFAINSLKHAFPHTSLEKLPFRANKFLLLLLCYALHT